MVVLSLPGRQVKPGEGAWPVLRLSAADVAEGKPLVETTAPLVLEGLHLELANAVAWEPEFRENLQPSWYRGEVIFNDEGRLPHNWNPCIRPVLSPFGIS